MKKLELLNPLRVLALSAIASGLILATGCNDDDDGDEEPAPTETTAEIIAGDSDLSELNAFLTADAELKGYLEGDAEYTVFAPTNEAFDRLRANLGVEDLSTIAPNVIGAVLRFHFVEGTKLRADLVNSSFTSIQGESSDVTADGFIAEAGTDTDGSEILEADIRATNGVVHKVETILIPPSIFASIGINLQTLAQPILLGASFTDIVSIIAVADSDVPAGEMSVSEILAKKDTLYTAFIPTNDVFDGAAAALQTTKEDLIASFTSSPAVARAFLLNHITAQGQLTEDDFTQGATIEMMSGLTLYFAEPGVTEQTPTGWVLMKDLEDPTTAIPILATDIYTTIDGELNPLPGAINGSLHVSSVIQ